MYTTILLKKIFYYEITIVENNLRDLKKTKITFIYEFNKGEKIVNRYGRI